MEADESIIAQLADTFQMSSWGSWNGYTGASCNMKQDSMRSFICIDVSFASSASYVLSEPTKTEILKEAQVANEPEAFVEHLRGLREPIEVIGLRLLSRNNFGRGPTSISIKLSAAKPIISRNKSASGGGASRLASARSS